MPPGLIIWIVAGAAAVFVLYRLVRLGARPRVRTLLRPEVLVAIVLILAAGVGSRYAAQAWKRPGSMPLIEALSSDMDMPAPQAAGPVVLAAVERAPVRPTARYTGTAAGFVEQEIYPRVTGSLLWMPFYAGDRVRKGQVLARLDTREYQTRVDERRAQKRMAEQMTAIARSEYEQNLAAAAQARAEVRGKEGALEEARRMQARAQGMLRESQAGVAEGREEVQAMAADLSAAQEERSEAAAMLESARAMQPEAEAMLAAMRADQDYWRQQIARTKALLDAGAVSREEFQREEAMAKGADARVRQSEAKLQAVQSDIRAARSRVAKAEAMIQARQAKLAQARSRLGGMEARVDQAQAEIAAAAGRVKMSEGDLEAARANARAMQAMAVAGSGKIRQAQAGAQGAEAALATADVVRGYTAIRSLVDGVVTQRLISPGTLVSPGQALLKVAQISPIRLQANVPEADLARIRPGAAVTVWTRGSEGARLSARVTSVQPVVDPVARTGLVEALVPNRDSRFRPGQYLVMDLATGGGRPALRVPTAAVLTQAAASSTILSTRTTRYVWLAEPGGAADQFTVRRVEVRTGASDGTYTEILSGLSEGQQVVVRGQDGLEPGQRVTAVPWGDEGPERLPAPPAVPGEHQGHGAGSQPAAPGGHEGHGAPASPAPSSAPTPPSAVPDHSGHERHPAPPPPPGDHSGHEGHGR